MNNYLLEGNNLIFINKEIDKLIKNNNFKEASINKYEVEEDFLDKILEDLDTYSLFSTKKVIIINNIDVLTQQELDQLKPKIKLLYKYLDNPNNDNMFIITLTKLTANSFHKKLKEKMNYIKVEQDINKIIKDKLKGYKITTNNINYLIELCDEDIYKIINECDKLTSYKIDNKEINKEDIDNLVVKKIKETKNIAFDFTRSLLEKDSKNALKLYNELIQEGNDTLKIIGLIASNLRNLLTIKTLENDGLSRIDIANILNKKPFYVQKQQELTRIYSTKEIIKCIKELNSIDLKCKSTDLDNNILLEIFIINM